MPSGFFVLHRFYLRVDDVLIRINDTRLYYEKGNDYILREFTSKHSNTKDLKVLPFPLTWFIDGLIGFKWLMIFYFVFVQVPRVFWGDSNEISQHLPLVHSLYEKLELWICKSNRVFVIHQFIYLIQFTYHSLHKFLASFWRSRKPYVFTRSYLQLQRFFLSAKVTC